MGKEICRHLTGPPGAGAGAGLLVQTPPRRAARMPKEGLHKPLIKLPFWFFVSDNFTHEEGVSFQLFSLFSALSCTRRLSEPFLVA